LENRKKMEPKDTTLRGPPMEYWNQLQKEDKDAYIELRNTFTGENSPSKIRHQAAFQKDLNQVRSYIESRKEQQDIRSVVCGIYFGPKFVCVNTRQLRFLIGRCKSSINNGLQNLGYTSSKQRARQVIVSALPSLAQNTSMLRQWTLRSAEQSSSPSVLPKPLAVPMSLPKASSFLAPERKPLPMPMINMAKISRSPSAEVTFGSNTGVHQNDFITFSSPDVSYREIPNPNSLPRPLSTPIGFHDNNLLDPLDDLGTQQGNDIHETDGFFDSMRIDNEWFGI
jgi:hypothetical protein